jgi:hypothetical protein
LFLKKAAIQFHAELCCQAVVLILHYTVFVQEFGLIDKKELAPLQELIESIIVPY